ncbi:hypothetical protein [Gelidibacter mesophilus]|uniref:hypothetical protein n=1 Tax=Gelidibacter mesophilus TaxID=169050 RepID=UPI00041EB9E1|nr:hypothetical protein [Gelidibacter mesophilus]
MTKISAKWIILLGLLGSILIGIFFAGSLFDRAASKTVAMAVNSINSKKELIVSIDDVNLSLTKGSISIKRINFEPDSVYYEKFKSGSIPKRLLSAMHISEIELMGLSMNSLFWDGRMDSVKISVKDVITNIYLREQNEKSAAVSQKPSSGVLDSLQLKGLKSITLGAIQVNNYQINLLNAETKDTISAILGDHTELNGLKLNKRQDGSDLFDLQTENLAINFKEQRLRLPKNEFEITLGSLDFNNSEQNLKLVDFAYLPIKSLEYVASKRKYADNLGDISFKYLTVDGLSINSYLENHFASAKKVNIDGLHANLLKNKQKPENTHKRPLLPQQLLKKLKVPIHIGEIAINNSSLTYKGIQPKNAKDIVVVHLTDLSVRVKHITSITDSLASGTPLTVALTSKILGNPTIDFSLTMPYNRHDDAFTYKGTVGSARLDLFNPILLPAAHVSIERGHMEGMTFFVNATPNHSTGVLTMRYSDLHVDIPLKHKLTEHTLSFLASSAIHKFNPKKNGKLRVAEIDYDRIPYKGIGGYVVKSILEGVTNTISPFGHQDEQTKSNAKKKKTIEVKIKKTKKRHKTS